MQSHNHMLMRSYVSTSRSRKHAWWYLYTEQQNSVVSRVCHTLLVEVLVRLGGSCQEFSQCSRYGEVLDVGGEGLASHHSAYPWD